MNFQLDWEKRSYKILKPLAANRHEMLRCYLYSYFRAEEHLRSLPEEPVIWPAVANTVTEIKTRTLVAVEAASVTTETEARKKRAQRGRFGR